MHSAIVDVAGDDGDDDDDDDDVAGDDGDDEDTGEEVDIDNDGDVVEEVVVVVVVDRVFLTDTRPASARLLVLEAVRTAAIV